MNCLLSCFSCCYPTANRADATPATPLINADASRRIDLLMDIIKSPDHGREGIYATKEHVIQQISKATKTSCDPIKTCTFELMGQVSHGMEVFTFALVQTEEEMRIKKITDLARYFSGDINAVESLGAVPNLKFNDFKN